MSEYQYFEFVALDAPLSDAALKWVRGLSTRAEITPTRFVNTYHWGDFKGDPVQMMVRAFDAHVYVSNFGICRFILRLPAGSIDTRLAKEFCVGAGANLMQKPRCVLVEFVMDDESGEWEMTDDGPGWMGSLIPLREALLDGDRRSLYLAWLANVQWEGLDDDALEPPVPAGLKERSASLEALARFLNIDPALVDAAAANSPSLGASDAPLAGLESWIRTLPEPEKDDALTSLLTHEGQAVRRTLLKRFRAARPGKAVASVSSFRQRSVGELRAQWEQRLHAPKAGSRAARGPRRAPR